VIGRRDEKAPAPSRLCRGRTSKQNPRADRRARVGKTAMSRAGVRIRQLRRRGSSSRKEVAARSTRAMSEGPTTRGEFEGTLKAVLGEVVVGSNGQIYPVHRRKHPLWRGKAGRSDGRLQPCCRTALARVRCIASARHASMNTARHVETTRRWRLASSRRVRQRNRTVEGTGSILRGIEGKIRAAHACGSPIPRWCLRGVVAS